MKPTWLIERGVYREHVAAVSAEIERQGMVVAEVDYRPGKHPPDDIVGAPPLADDACVILWGTLPLMQQIQLRRRWVPGGWCNVEALNCSAYYAYFGQYLLNSYYSVLPGVEAIRLQEQLFAEFGPEDEVFVRPNGVHKLFTGTVAYKDNFRDAIAPARYDPTTLIVISTPKEIGREWRLMIVNDEIVALCQYRDYGGTALSRGCPDDVLQFTSNMLRNVRWRPDHAFLIDVCESNDRLYLLELNSFSCSGWYDCDVAAIVRAASAAAENEWNTRHAGKNPECRGAAVMSNKDFPSQCPNCGLVLLWGAIFDAFDEEAVFGPILGLHKNVDKETAKAGYVGLSSMWMYDVAPELYRCPRCGIDPMPTTKSGTES